jgi:predicted nuclease of predicted toxin-antitoxin system
VKFLIDANLPPRLCAWLQSRRHEAEHLFHLGLLDATDTEIWRRAEVENLVIVSKDVDFYDRALVFGPPPQVVHVSVGNCSNARLLEILAIEWDEIERSLLSGSRLISITQQKLEVFA